MIRLGVAAVLVVGCTFEQDQTSLSDLHVLGGECPSGVDAKPLLVAALGHPESNVGQMQCGVDELLTVSGPVPPPPNVIDGPSCCYAATCGAPLGPVDAAKFFDATCLGLACSNLDLSRFTVATAQSKLAATGLQCTIDPSTTTPGDQMAVRCWYEENIRYTCGGLSS